MLPSRRPSDDPGSERMKLTERRRLVLSDVHISLETRGELLRRIDEIYAQLLALTNKDDDSAKLNGAAAPWAASLSPSPTEDSDASFDGDATLVPEGPSPVPGTPTGHPDVLETSRGPCVPFGPVPRTLTRSVGRRCESKPETDGAPPVAAGAAAPQKGGVRRKEARQQPQRAPPPAAKKVDAARGTSLPFRAKPLPVRILADAYNQQKRAEEEVRQLRSKARAEEMLRCAAVPFTTRRPMFQRQCSDPVPNVPVRETLSRASRRAPPATDILQGDCRKARRSRSCPKLDQRTLPERPVKPPPTSMPGKIKPNTTLLLRQQAALERRREEERRRDEEEQRERVRTLRKSWVALQMRALECCLPRPRSSDFIRDRLRAHRMAAMQRLEDYRQELQDIQDRVSSNPLLVERQALYGAQRLLEHQYERKLHELGLDNDFLESKAALHVQRRRSGSLDSRSAASGSSAGSPHHSRREMPAAGFDARPRSASLRSSAASDERSDTESTRGSHVDLSQASGEGESDRKSAKSASSSSIRTPAST